MRLAPVAIAAAISVMTEPMHRPSCGAAAKTIRVNGVCIEEGKPSYSRCAAAARQYRAKALLPSAVRLQHKITLSLVLLGQREDRLTLLDRLDDLQLIERLRIDGGWIAAE